MGSGYYSFLINWSFWEAGVFRSDLRTEALLSGSLYAPEYEFQNVIFRTLQSPVDYVRVCVFEKVGRWDVSWQDCQGDMESQSPRVYCPSIHVQGLCYLSRFMSWSSFQWYGKEGNFLSSMYVFTGFTTMCLLIKIYMVRKNSHLRKKMASDHSLPLSWPSLCGSGRRWTTNTLQGPFWLWYFSIL